MTWITMPPITQLTDRLFLGCFTDGHDAVTQQALGITAVCNLTDEAYACPTEHWAQIGQRDGEGIHAGRIAEFVKWMQEQRDHERKVLIHCHMGISRTSAFTIFWQMWADGVSRDDDLRQAWSRREDAMRVVRPIIEPHYQLKQSLLTYYERYGPA